jgi:hypothetical protein
MVSTFAMETAILHLLETAEVLLTVHVVTTNLSGYQVHAFIYLF